MSDPDARWLGRAVEIAVASAAADGGPFGAVVVADGVVLGEGTNRVTASLDPTAHAEIVAIRQACRARDDFSLTGATLYASCEPCPLCLAAALWARLDRVVYAADRDDAAGAGFDDRAFHDLFAGPRERWPLAVVHHPSADAAAPFAAWKDNPDRTPY